MIDNISSGLEFDGFVVHPFFKEEKYMGKKIERQKKPELDLLESIILKVNEEKDVAEFDLQRVLDKGFIRGGLIVKEIEKRLKAFEKLLTYLRGLK